MAKEKISKWFSNKNLRLSLHRKKSKSSNNGSFSSSSSTLSSPSSPKNPNKEDELKEVFRFFDSNGDDKISALELRSFFGSIGEYMSHEEAEAAIDELDSDGDKLLDFKDFLKLMKKERSENQEQEGGDDDDLKRAFEMFEMEKGSGCITPKGLQRMLHRLGDSTSYDECVAMIHVFDIDGNGVLDFQEFYQMMA